MYYLLGWLFGEPSDHNELISVSGESWKAIFKVAQRLIDHFNPFYFMVYALVASATVLSTVCQHQNPNLFPLFYPWFPALMIGPVLAGGYQRFASRLCIVSAIIAATVAGEPPYIWILANVFAVQGAHRIYRRCRWSLRNVERKTDFLIYLGGGVRVLVRRCDFRSSYIGVFDSVVQTDNSTDHDVLYMVFWGLHCFFSRILATATNLDTAALRLPT